LDATLTLLRLASAERHSVTPQACAPARQPSPQKAVDRAKCELAELSALCRSRDRLE